MYLLTPISSAVPEPATVLAIGSVLVVLAVRYGLRMRHRRPGEAGWAFR